MPFFQPSLDDMNKEVLAWDMFQMLQEKPMYLLRTVPLRFSSVDEYLDVFEPLLLEECRAQTLRSMQENQVEDDHLQIASIDPNEPFRYITFALESKGDANEPQVKTYYDNDLVFVSYEQLLDDGAEEGEEGEARPPPHQFHALGLVAHTTADSVKLKFYLPELPTSRLIPSQHKRLSLLRKVMVPTSGKWWLKKLGNMVTINREFQARILHPPPCSSPAICACASAHALA
jgi:hypothetical protein